MASTYLTRNMTTQGSSIKGTFSCWFKLASDNLTGGFLGHYFSGSYLFDICMQDGSIEVADFRGNLGGYLLRKRTTQKLRDLNAWYHLYVAIDRSLGTAEDRCKIYLNGDRVTDFQSAENANYSQQTSGSHTGAVSMNNDYTARVGVRYNTTYFDGSISHMHWVDGSVIDISQFGSTDSTTGEWKINTSPTVADYGTNGFFILKDGNTITDQSSGGSYDFTVGGGTLTKTEDCPSNVFATWNPLFYAGGAVTHSAGNTRFAESGNYWKSTLATIGASTGKYYAEFKCNGNWMIAGVVDLNDTLGYGIVDRNFFSTTHISNQGYGLYNADGSLRYRGSETTYGSSYGSGDILQIALDCDNNRVFFGINGTWQNSADPTNSGTGFAMNATNPIYTFACSVQNDEVHANFGGGFFATTEITTNTGTGFQDADGKGRFFYNPPTNFRCLSTKGLNQ